MPASRYLDSLSFGLVVNTMALLFLLDAGRRRFQWPAAARWSVMALWVAVGAIGVAGLSAETLAQGGAERRYWMGAYVRNIRQLVLSGDPATLLKKKE